MITGKANDMIEKADIMGLPIDIVKKEELREEISQYLQNDYLNVIFFVTIQMIERSAADVKYKELLESSDYLLPAEKAVLTVYLQELLSDSDIFTDYQSFLEISNRTEIDKIHFAKSIYYIGKTKEETQLLVDYSFEKYPWLNAQGMYCEGMEDKDDLLVNEINAVAPDILIVALESPFQEEWVIKNSTKLNAKLCIGIGGILEEILDKETKKDVFSCFLKKCRGLAKRIHWNNFRKNVERYHKK